MPQLYCNMKERLLFFIKYYLFWILLFGFFRLLFIIYHFDKFETSSFFDYLAILMHGLKLDLSMASYIMFFPTLIFILFSGFKNKIEMPVIFGFSLIILTIVTILHLVDLELYDYWRFRLDDEFLSYMEHPKEMLANMQWYHYIFLLVILFAVNYFFIKVVYAKLLYFNIKIAKRSWTSIVVFIILFMALIVPMRGGLGVAPINIGSVYFHKEIIVNHATINPVWSLLFSYTEKDKLNYSFTFFEEDKETELLSEWYSIKNDGKGKRDLLNTERPNIVLVLLESFSSNLLKEVSGLEGVTPQLSSLINEGIWFTNFYASGSNSKSGLGAILSGYPALPTTCILHYEKKTETLPGINKILKDYGYQSKFLYGGDIDFAHFKSFLIHNEFDEIISHNNFADSAFMSKWGVPDHIVFDRMLEECNQSDKPFFNAMFTLSSHEPYEVPMETQIEGNGNLEKFLNSVYYTDRSLGQFIQKAKKQDWWDNTLVILVADHGSRIENITHYDSTRFQIPMLWLGGALKEIGIQNKKYGSQVDVSTTLLSQLNIEGNEFKFSKDLFDSLSPSLALYTCNNGLAMVNDSVYTILDLTNQSFLESNARQKDYYEDLLKAYTQWLLKDFVSR